MKELIGSNANILLGYMVDKSIVSSIEVALVVSEPAYEYDENRILTKVRRAETIRFCASPAGLVTLADEFHRLADEADELVRKLTQKDGDKGKE